MQDRSRGLAFVAFLLAVTALWLPWWRVAWDDGTVVVRESVSAFRPHPPLTTSWGPWLTGALCAGACLLLFVRIAAGSQKNEPKSWHRDLTFSAFLLAAAMASCLLWPQDVPSFWGSRTYTVENGTGPPVTQGAMPGLSWWLAFVAVVLLGIASWMTRTAWLQPAPAPTDPTTPK